MNTVASRIKPHFIVSTGDNFYNYGLVSTDDPLFDTSFKNIYTGNALKNIPWHVVLGNHDYGDWDDECMAPCTRSPLYQLSVELMQRDERWHCERSFTLDFPDVKLQLFFMDTSPFIAKYQNQTWSSYAGGILQQSAEAQSKELEVYLASSPKDTAKIVIGHHPPYSNGDHGDNPEIINALVGIFSKYDVLAFISGHDHNLEHIYRNGLHVFVAGGGSESDRGFAGKEVDAMYQYPYSGFAAVYSSSNNDDGGIKVQNELRKGEVKVEFYNLEKGVKPAYVVNL